MSKWSYKMKGVIPPMITPFDKDGNVDEQALRTLVRYLRDKVHGVFICGSYGCGPMMSVEERKRVAEIVMEEKGNLQVIVMVGTANTRDSVELAVHARDIGCDAVSAVSPYYFHHNMNDVFGFYQDIINAVGPDYPVYIYTNPKFSGYPVDIKTIRRLQQIGLRGCKAASFDIMEYANMMREFENDDFDVALGTEALWLPANIYGGEAFIPGLANAFPEICNQMYEEAVRGDYEACRKTQFKVNKIRDIMYLAPSTQLAIYAMLEIRGIIAAYPRKPFQPATREQIDAIKAELIKLGMLEA